MDSSSDLHGKEPPLLPPPIWVADSLFGSENSSSGLSTPFGSVGSTRTETESDDDEGEDFLAELTRQMAGYMLQDEDDDLNILVEDHEHSPKFKEVKSFSRYFSTFLVLILVKSLICFDVSLWL